MSLAPLLLLQQILLMLLRIIILVWVVYIPRHCISIMFFISLTKVTQSDGGVSEVGGRYVQLSFWVALTLELISVLEALTGRTAANREVRRRNDNFATLFLFIPCVS